MTCPLCQRSLDTMAATELLRAAASMAPPLTGPLNGQVIEAAFLLSCMIDIEITRLAASPADRDRLLGLVAEHITQRMGQPA